MEFDAAPRLSVLQEIMEETSRKVIIFAMFRSTIDTIHTHLTKHGYAAECIHGGIAAAKRGDIIRRFQQEANPQVLVIQPQAAAHGVTLTAANTVCWFSPTTSAEAYLQANARVHRAGQRNPCLVVHLCSSPVERKLYKALEEKTMAQGNLLDMFRNFLGGGL